MKLTKIFTNNSETIPIDFSANKTNYGNFLNETKENNFFTTPGETFGNFEKTDEIKIDTTRRFLIMNTTYQFLENIDGNITKNSSGFQNNSENFIDIFSKFYKIDQNNTVTTSLYSTIMKFQIHNFSFQN